LRSYVIKGSFYKGGSVIAGHYNANHYIIFP
jgi:hypothetical protein